jgi:hypothetical protein
MERRLRGSARTTAAPPHRLPGGRRPWLIGGGVAVLLLAAVLTWVWWPDPGPDPRARVYTDATACLLTPADGVTGKQAAPVWAGMQQASLATRGKVQYLEVDGPQTGRQAATYLATLTGSKCDLILTVGAAPNAALTEGAASYPNVHFVLIGKGTPQTNVTVVDDSVASRVTESVRAAVHDALAD